MPVTRLYGILPESSTVIINTLLLPKSLYFTDITPKSIDYSDINYAMYAGVSEYNDIVSIIARKDASTPVINAYRMSLTSCSANFLM